MRILRTGGSETMCVAARVADLDDECRWVVGDVSRFAGSAF